MKLELHRFSSQADSTLGVLFRTLTKHSRSFLAFTVEDEARTYKVFGETRIPRGTYRLGLRREGGFHKRYGKRFSDMHLGMIELLNVPNFTYILIHIGNTDDDTAGCILVGDGAKRDRNGEGHIISSTDAYKRIYPNIALALQRQEKVFLTIKDFA